MSEDGTENEIGTEIATVITRNAIHAPAEQTQHQDGERHNGVPAANQIQQQPKVTHPTTPP